MYVMLNDPLQWVVTVTAGTRLLTVNLVSCNDKFAFTLSFLLSSLFTVGVSMQYCWIQPRNMYRKLAAKHVTKIVRFDWSAVFESLWYNKLTPNRAPKMSKTFIGGAVCREFESEAPAAEEMLDWVVCSSEQFCFQMCLECGDGSGTFSRWRQRVPDSWCSDTESLGSILFGARFLYKFFEYVIFIIFSTILTFTINKRSDHVRFIPQLNVHTTILLLQGR